MEMILPDFDFIVNRKYYYKNTFLIDIGIKRYSKNAIHYIYNKENRYIVVWCKNKNNIKFMIDYKIKIHEKDEISNILRFLTYNVLINKEKARLADINNRCDQILYLKNIYYDIYYNISKHKQQTEGKLKLLKRQSIHGKKYIQKLEYLLSLNKLYF